MELFSGAESEVVLQLKKLYEKQIQTLKDELKVYTTHNDYEQEEGNCYIVPVGVCEVTRDGCRCGGKKDGHFDHPQKCRRGCWNLISPNEGPIECFYRCVICNILLCEECASKQPYQPVSDFHCTDCWDALQTIEKKTGIKD